jgi:uncharacterized OsmC-like protein
MRMADPAYVSNVRVERVAGPLKRAYLPLDTTVLFGVHGGIADHFGVAPGGPAEQAATLDYVVAATVACLTGTFGGALEARGIPAAEPRLVANGSGEVEVEDGVLVIKRIHVGYELTVDPDADRAKIQRAFDHHMERCPVHRSLGSAIECTASLALIENAEAPRPATLTS